MIRTFCFYDESTGLFTGNTFSAASVDVDRIVAKNTPPGMRAIEGRYDHRSQRVDLATGTVIDDPELSRMHHERDERRKRRDVARAKIADLERRQLRAQRELLLNPDNAEARARIQAIEEQISELRKQCSHE